MPPVIWSINPSKRKQKYNTTKIAKLIKTISFRLSFFKLRKPTIIPINRIKMIEFTLKDMIKKIIDTRQMPIKKEKNPINSPVFILL
jgi:hypothetical protein